MEPMYLYLTPTQVKAWGKASEDKATLKPCNSAGSYPVTVKDEKGPASSYDNTLLTAVTQAIHKP